MLLLATRLSSGQVIRAGSSVKSFAMSSMPTYLLAPQRHAYVSSRIWLGLRFRILTITFTSSESRC
jgi:hypothetical protein